MLRAINSGQVLVSASDLFEGPLDAQVSRELRMCGARGGSDHLGLYERMFLVLWSIGAAVTVEGGYCGDQRYDIGCPEQRLAVECGNTWCGKIFNACLWGWRVMVLPFSSLVYFTFSVVPERQDELARERQADLFRHNATAKVSIFGAKKTPGGNHE